MKLFNVFKNLKSYLAYVLVQSMVAAGGQFVKKERKKEKEFVRLIFRYCRKPFQSRLNSMSYKLIKTHRSNQYNISESNLKVLLKNLVCKKCNLI